MIDALTDSRKAPANGSATARVDLLLIAEMVRPGARVLDVGCGAGELLKLLETTRQVDGRGVELSQTGVNICVAKGLSVVQGDADRDLVNYPDNAFDYAILSQTLQATQRPKYVLEELLRIGRHAIVSFPNFGNWRIRMQLLIEGKMPVTHNLPERWYLSPNIHFCTIKDFLDLCAEVGANVERQVALNAYGRRLGGVPLFMQNIIGEQAVFLLTRR
ncbi:MAG: methionine biosynthesis protein MetW [Hyphomicrobiales bacterium]|nr:methionine biosynthesis protein MetW [Hyphomicrobiales bacterium]